MLRWRISYSSLLRQFHCTALEGLLNFLTAEQVKLFLLLTEFQHVTSLLTRFQPVLFITTVPCHHGIYKHNTTSADIK